MNALKKYYIARWFYLHHFHLIPFLIKLSIYLINNCFIDYKCEIGKGCKIGYRGMSVVIHKNAKIGANCIIGTCVTIGGNKKPNTIDEGGVPVIEDNCYIATGAKILGGIRIGEGSFIGANTVVTRDVPPHSLVSGIPGKIIKENINVKDYF